MVWYSDSAASRIAAQSSQDNSSSDSASSRSTPSGNFSYSSNPSYASDSASSRSSPEGNFSYFSHSTSAPASMGPSSFSGNSGGLYGSVANALSGGYGQYQQPPSKGVMSQNAAADLIRGFESFKPKPYYDVNAWRTGYGSDTVTNPDGTVAPVTPYTSVTPQQAQADLVRRVPQFQKGIVNSIGQDAWGNLSIPEQAAISSMAYNYGSGFLDKPYATPLKSALQSGDPQAISTAIVARAGDNNGVNEDRRNKEAAYALRDSPKGNYVTVASVPPIPPPVQRTPSTTQVAQVPQAYGYGAYQTGPQPPTSFSSPSAPQAYGYGVAQTGPQAPTTLSTQAPEPQVAYGASAYQSGPQLPTSFATAPAVSPPVTQAYGYGNYQTGPQAPGTLLTAPDTQVAAIGTNPHLYPKPITNPVAPMSKLAAIGTDVMLGPGAHTLVNELRNEPLSSQPNSIGLQNSQDRGSTQSQVASVDTPKKLSWQDILAEMNKGVTNPTQQLANTLKVLSNPTIMYG